MARVAASNQVTARAAETLWLMAVRLTSTTTLPLVKYSSIASLRAFGDESMRRLPDGGPLYMLGAAIVPDHRCDDVRALLRGRGHLGVLWELPRSLGLTQPC